MGVGRRYFIMCVQLHDHFCACVRMRSNAWVVPTCGEMSVYLDYNATTPLAPDVLEVITTALKDAWANPNSNHVAGKAGSTHRYIY